MGLTYYRYDEYYAFVSEGTMEGERDHAGRMVYQLPRNATIEEPPEEPGHVAVFDERNRRWNMLRDYRGEKWLNQIGIETVIKRPGDPWDWGFRPCGVPSSS